MAGGGTRSKTKVSAIESLKKQLRSILDKQTLSNSDRAKVADLEREIERRERDLSRRESLNSFRLEQVEERLKSLDSSSILTNPNTSQTANCNDTTLLLSASSTEELVVERAAVQQHLIPVEPIVPPIISVEDDLTFETIDLVSPIPESAPSVVNLVPKATSSPIFHSNDPVTSSYSQASHDQSSSSSTHTAVPQNQNQPTEDGHSIMATNRPDTEATEEESDQVHCYATLLSDIREFVRDEIRREGASIYERVIDTLRPTLDQVADRTEITAASVEEHSNGLAHLKADLERQIRDAVSESKVFTQCVEARIDADIEHILASRAESKQSDWKLDNPFKKPSELFTPVKEEKCTPNPFTSEKCSDSMEEQHGLLDAIHKRQSSHFPPSQDKSAHMTHNYRPKPEPYHNFAGNLQGRRTDSWCSLNNMGGESTRNPSDAAGMARTGLTSASGQEIVIKVENPAPQHNQSQQMSSAQASIFHKPEKFDRPTAYRTAAGFIKDFRFYISSVYPRDRTKWVRAMYGFLKGRAQIWFKETIMDDPLYLDGEPEITFGTFIQAFSTPDPKIIMEGYRSRKQKDKETVNTYIDDMEAMLAETGLTHFHQIEYILAGMKPAIGNILRLRNLRDISQVRQHAAELELQFKTAEQTSHINCITEQQSAPEGASAQLNRVGFNPKYNDKRKRHTHNSSSSSSDQSSSDDPYQTIKSMVTKEFWDLMRLKDEKLKLLTELHGKQNKGDQSNRWHRKGGNSRYSDQGKEKGQQSKSSSSSSSSSSSQESPKKPYRYGGNRNNNKRYLNAMLTLASDMAKETESSQESDCESDDWLTDNNEGETEVEENAD